MFLENWISGQKIGATDVLLKSLNEYHQHTLSIIFSKGYYEAHPNFILWSKLSHFSEICGLFITTHIVFPPFTEI